MRYDECRELEKEIDCRHTLTAALEATSDLVPRPDAESIIMCLEKVRRGFDSLVCDKKCPS